MIHLAIGLVMSGQIILAKGSNFESTVTSDDTATWNILLSYLVAECRRCSVFLIIHH